MMKGKEEMRRRGRKEQNDRMKRRGSIRGTRMSNNNRKEEI